MQKGKENCTPGEHGSYIMPVRARHVLLFQSYLARGQIISAGYSELAWIDLHRREREVTADEEEETEADD
jgi:hypothetical protein